MSLTFVHALWGDELVANWPKILRDVQWTDIWRRRCHTPRMVFAYGQQNFRYLDAWGLEPILASEQAIVDFDGVGNRQGDGNTPHGGHNFNVSHWTHKAHAICQAFDRGATEIVWIDWDIGMRLAQADVLKTLSDGPPLQCRMRAYKRRQPPLWQNFVCHGGVYYCRDRRIFDEALAARPEWKGVADEGIVTEIIGRLYFDGKVEDCQQFADAGFDNHRLHSTRTNAIPAPTDNQTLYYEGSWVRSLPFTQRMYD